MSTNDGASVVDDGTSGLLAAIGELAEFATRDFVVEDLLRRLCDAAAHALRVDGVGVMAVDLGRSRFVRVNHPALEPLERLQETLQTGPCRDAIDTGAPAAAGTLTEIQRCWPGFSGVAVLCGIKSVVALPLMSRGRCWGSLDLYWNHAHTPDDTELAEALLLANVAVSYLVMAADRAESRAAQEQLANRAMHDQLTGLPNRGLIHELIYHALAAAERHRTSVAVLFVDLDKFKTVNDTHGHLAGDAVLTEVARRLRAAVRTGDTVGRLSGDEFLVLCENLPLTGSDITAVTTKLATRIRSALAQPIHITAAGVDVTVTASVGIAVTGDRPSAADLIHEADIAMYEAKALGPDGTVIHNSLTEVELDTRRGMERRLFEALKRGEFAVFYQPVVDAAGTLIAVEALLRWQHPTQGIVPAAEFIHIAESTGAIVPIGHWVIREALHQLHQWRHACPDTAPRFVLCNLSPRELIAPDLPEVITTALTDTQLAPADLGLEIVENNLADPRLLDAVTGLQYRGHPLAIDDFGTGYSSLARLVDIPVAYVKIDRSLVVRLPEDPRSRALVESVVTIAGNLGIQVISEGIETQAQTDHLTRAGSDLFQGYHHGRPMPHHRITDLLTT